MGHKRLGDLPRTYLWRQVLETLHDGGDHVAVASAAMKAIKKVLFQVADDPALIEAVWLLIEIPHAARCDDFQKALANLGLQTPREPSLLEIQAAMTKAIERVARHSRNRNDIGLIAQRAACTALTHFLRNRLFSLFGITAESVRAEIAKLATVKQFSIVGRVFFGEFLHDAMMFYLDRILPGMIGPGKPFPTVADERIFTERLRRHCQETAVIVEEFCGKWAKKKRYEEGEVRREHVRKFVYVAIKKMCDEMARREEAARAI